MKRFTQKFFLLAIGMILSVGAYAQDAITHHWPEVRFTIVKADGTPTDGLMYHVPGWDAWLRYKQLSNSKYVVNGHVRVQKYEKTGVVDENDPTSAGVFKARLVTRYAISSDNRLKVPELKDNTPLYVKINGEGEPIDIRGLKYKDVFGTPTGPDGTSYDVVIIDEDKGTVLSTYKDAVNNKEYFKIPTSMTHTTSGEIYTIDEIGDYAFRQYSRGSDGWNFVRVSRIIIPKEITKIGRGAFFMNASTEEVVFEDDCPVNEFLEFNFQDWTSLETITFSANVNKLWGTVLGGCPALNKITFKNATPPTLTPFEWSGVTRKVFETTTEQSPTVPEKCIIEVPLHAAKTYVDSNDKFEEFPMSSEISFIQNNKELEMITYCSDLEFTLKQFDNSTSTPTWKDDAVMKAYYVESNKVDVPNANIELTQITETAKIPTVIDYEDDGTEEGSPRYFGVILTGDPGQTYKIFYPNNLLSNVLQSEDNCLKGVNENTQINIVENYLYFVISNGKFHPVRSSGTLGAHKAYVKYGGDITGGYGARDFSISFPGEATGIMNAEVKSAQNDAWYTMQGIQVQQPSKGVFIKNGKKFVIK